MSKVVVTGSSGLLGREVMQAFRNDDRWDAVGIHHSHPVDQSESVDLREEDAVRDYMDRHRPDWIVHCAADRDPDHCERYPEEAHRLNVGSVRSILNTAPASCRILLISSDYVFSGEQPPYSEDSEVDPVNVYGQTKVEGERLVLGRPGTIVLRVPLLIGAGSTWETSGFLYKTTELLRSENVAELDNVGVRFPTWTRDVADWIHWLILNNGVGIYHFRGLRGNTKYGWAQELAELLGCSAQHISPSEDGASVARRPKDTHLELKRVEQCGYDRIHDFKDAASTVLRHFGKLPG